MKLPFQSPSNPNLPVHPIQFSLDHHQITIKAHQIPIKNQHHHLKNGHVSYMASIAKLGAVLAEVRLPDVARSGWPILRLLGHVARVVRRDTGEGWDNRGDFEGDFRVTLMVMLWWFMIISG